MNNLIKINTFTDTSVIMPVDGFLVQTQYIEDYGARWKYKFGCTYAYPCSNTADSALKLQQVLDKELINNSIAKEYATSIFYANKNFIIS